MLLLLHPRPVCLLALKSLSSLRERKCRTCLYSPVANGLFALLEINPPPFCLLDEVDAALDESNVTRFCDILRQLGQRTQFIVITHNRVTMTSAQVIYGVSMGADSVSRLISLKLEEAT